MQALLSASPSAVEKVAINFNQPNEQSLDELTLADIDRYMKEGHFLKGSMLPKIEAARAFVKGAKNRTAIIASLEQAKDALDGVTGTTIKHQ